jgi:hypothetical protein
VRRDGASGDVAAPEAALRALTVATCALAAALVVRRTGL